MFIDRKVSQKFLDFAAAHLSWMAFFVKQDIASNPVDVGFFGPDGVMFQSDFLADLIQQFLGTTFLHLFLNNFGLTAF